MAGRPATKKASVTEKSQTAQAVLEKINAGTAELKAEGINDVVRESGAQKIAMDEEIPCRSIVFGGLTWVSPKTGAHYRWNGIGDVEYLPFAELVTLNNTNRNFLFRPLFVVQDARAVEYFRLLPTYEKVARIGDLDAALAGSVAEVESVVNDALRVGMRSVLISKIREMRKSGALRDIDVISLLEQKLSFDFTGDSPLDTEE